MNLKDIEQSNKNIFFYWDGPLSESRMQILEDAVNSTAYFNPNNNIWVVTNTARLLEQKFKYKNIKTVRWDNDIYNYTFNPKKVTDIYSKCHPRDRSDLLRILFLYAYGGSYIDTDDIAIAPICDKQNIICRSYDPHVCHYNKITPKECVPGKYREVQGYDEIPMFPRNDCWLNFEPGNRILEELLNNDYFLNAEKPISICGEVSWQSLTLEVIQNNINTLNTDFHFFLTLMYVYESHVSVASIWDRCARGGEMCDIWPGPKGETWGKYRTTKNEALEFFNIAKSKLPYCSHFWLHDKDMEKEWLIDNPDEKGKYLISTWIYNEIKKLIR
jgi:hypothetical protein